MTLAYRAATVVAMDRAECRDKRQHRKLRQDWAIVAFDFGRWVASMAETIRANNRKNGAAK